MFEQSGTFKNEFLKLGIPAADYDIQNVYGQTDYVVDLFVEIEKAYNNKESLFDEITQDDLIMAFFPCTYFCSNSNILMHLFGKNYTNLSLSERFNAILKRSADREFFYTTLIKFFAIAYIRGLRIIVENPNTNNYLHNNFLTPPLLTDMDRRKRGDYMKKPTDFYFVNCTPTYGASYKRVSEHRTVRSLPRSAEVGVCGKERSEISPEYAKNFICDFILGKEQKGITQQTIKF